MMERWPRLDGGEASPLPGAIYKQQPEDFQVTELTDIEFADAGEHLYGYVEKTNLTTREVAQRLAVLGAVPVDDVGYAGMKDKRAQTRQWFSLPTKRDDVFAELCASEAAPGLELLETRRHSRKLRRGQLVGNRFLIILRKLSSPVCPERVKIVAEQGVPNYFGAQRFGGDNLEAACRWLARRRKIRVSQFRKSLYLSVLRSFIFNELLAERVKDASWNQILDGDVVLDDSASGPLWGRGRSAVSGRAAELERKALAPHRQLLEDLEYAGVSQQRRALCLKAGAFDLQPSSDESVQLTFELPAGAYATVLLRELVELDHGHQPNQRADSAAFSNRTAS